jgi:hypothetical protein
MSSRHPPLPFETTGKKIMVRINQPLGLCVEQSKKDHKDGGEIFTNTR